MTSRRTLMPEYLIRLGGVLGLLGVSIYVILRVDNLLVSFVIAFVISHLLAPWVNALERRGLPRGLGVVSLFALLTGLAVVAFYFLMPPVIKQTASFKSEFPHLIQGVTGILSTWERHLGSLVSGIRPMDVSPHVGAALMTYFRTGFENLPGMISACLTVMVLAPFLAFFMLLDGRAVTKKLLAMVPNNLFEPALSLHHQINTQVGAFIRARLLEAIMTGLVVWIGLSLMGLPYSFLLGSFAALTNLIPYVGPLIGAVPGLLMALIIGISGIQILFLLGIYVVAQVIDNVLIIPVLVAKTVNLHPVTTAVVIIIGAQVLGVLGMIISIPVFCIVKLFVITLYSHFVDIKN